MSKQDDLLTSDKEQAGKPSGDATSAGEGIAAEIRAVDPQQRQGSSAYTALALLLLVVLLAGGYYLVNGSLTPQETQIDLGQQKAAPKRFPIVRPVLEAVAEQPPLAEAEKVTTPDAQKTAAIETETVEEPKPVAVAQTTADVPEQPVEKKKTPVATGPVYFAQVGPFLSKSSAEKNRKKLREQGFKVEMATGSGMVEMTRLLEGIYPQEAAREQLRVVKERIGDAFMLPLGKKLAVYVGSFTDAARAQRYADQLAQKGVNVTPVTSDIELNGRILIVARGDQQEVDAAAAKVQALGFRVKVLQK